MTVAQHWPASLPGRAEMMPKRRTGQREHEEITGSYHADQAMAEKR